MFTYLLSVRSVFHQVYLSIAAFPNYHEESVIIHSSRSFSLRVFYHRESKHRIHRIRGIYYSYKNITDELNGVKKVDSDEIFQRARNQQRRQRSFGFSSLGNCQLTADDD